MNEELKIIIKAVSDEAKKNLAGIKDELNGMEKSGVSSGKSIKESMASIKKGAAIAVGAIAALTTAMIALGKRSLEYRESQARLISGFQSVGASAEQASQTYQKLFRFLGKADTANEAANLLAHLTTNEQDLAEWTMILQGVYAKFPDSLPIESLAEAANETARTGTVTGVLADALNWAGMSEDAMNAKLAQTSSLEEREALLRTTLNQLYGNAAVLYEKNNSAMLAYNESQYRLNQALAEATVYIYPLLTAINNLAATVLSVLKPAFETIAAVIIVFVQWIAAAIKAVGSFFGLFSGRGVQAVNSVSANMGQIKNNTSDVTSGVGDLEDAFKKAEEQAKKLKKQTMGFDELNILQSGTNVSAGVGKIDIPKTEMPEFNIPIVGSIDTDLPGLTEFENKVDSIREKLESLLPVLAQIGAGFAGWKISNILSDIIKTQKTLKRLEDSKTDLADIIYDLTSMGDTESAREWDKSYKKAAAGAEQAKKKLNGYYAVLKKVGGYLLIIAGTLLTIKGYSDSWVKGVDWNSLITTLSGLALIIAGATLAFGALGGAMASVIGGVSLLILSIKDIVANGLNWKNGLGLIAAALLIAIPIIIAFNTALIANPIGLIIVAIAALIAGIAALVIAFATEKPAIKSVEEAQRALNEAKEKAAEAENSYINAVDGAEAALTRLKDAEAAAGVTGAELYEQVQNGTLDYADMTDAQKECYKAYLNNEKKQKELVESTAALNEARKAEVIASYENQLALAKESGSYDEFKNSVVEAFEKGELSADEARDLIAKSMSEMSDSAQQAFMEDIPLSLKEGLNPHQYESSGTKIKKWFGKLWEGIKDVFQNIGTWFKNIFNDAWKAVKGVFSGVGEFFAGVWNTIKKQFSEIGQKIGNAVSNAFSKAVNWVLDKAISLINGFIKALNKAISIINKIPGVDIKKIDMLEVPQMAKGGIVNSATLALFGEQGREAVIPLENNTEWMDVLANRIAERNSAPSKIVLMVDDKELGYASINSINGITKQTGKLQLALA